MAPTTKEHAVRRSVSTATNIDHKNTAIDKKIKGGVFLTSVAGFSMLFGFGLTVALTRKKDPGMFSKSIAGSREMPESGGALAMRALAWGTVYSVTGVGAFCFLVWKLLGAQNMVEFREKMQTIFPQAPRREQQGRNEFKSIRELVNYFIDEDTRQMEEKAKDKKT